MKIKSIIILVALFAATIIKAQPDLVPVRPFPTTPTNGNDPRSPILVPVLYIDGYTLTAGDNTIGSTIRILDADDNVVFSTYVSIEGDIELPETLSGTYTIEVVFDNVTFVGEIEL